MGITTTTTSTGPAGPVGPTSAASSAEAGRSTSPEWETSPPRLPPRPRAESTSDSDQTPLFSVIDSLIAQMHTPTLLANVCIHLVPPMYHFVDRYGLRAPTNSLIQRL